MPLTEPVRTLDASPRSVKDARRWAAAACRELGRDDLVDSAALGISELVTNALLHAGPPISVRLRGTPTHPRIEVSDGSATPPVPTPRTSHDGSAPGDDTMLTTVGRGLSVVATHSHAWGSYQHSEGKTVWFEPAPTDGDVVPLVQLDDDLSTTGDSEAGDDGDHGYVVTLTGVPVASYRGWQVHVTDLQRELRLLALAHEAAYPMARELSDLFTQFATEVRRIRGLADISRATSTTVDVVVRVPHDTPSVMAQMTEVLELADAFCRAERMLTPPIGAELLEFQRWLLGEFVRQPASLAPRPWGA